MEIRSMNVVIATYGSTGDIFPLIRLGVALKESRHSVSFATSKAFRNDVEEAGLNYCQLPPHWERSELTRCMAHIQKYRSPVRQLRELYRAALPCFDAIIDGLDAALENADCLISSYLFPVGKSLADRRGIPSVSFAFAHNAIPSGVYPPHGVPRLNVLPSWMRIRWNRLAWRVGNVAVDRAINLTISEILDRKGLPRVRDFFSKPSDLVLVGVSSSLMRPEIDLDPRFQFTGYCRWQAPECASSETQLRAFKGHTGVPILTFGSMAYDDPKAWFDRFLASWPSDRKIVVQPGWSGFSVPEETDRILGLGAMSHDQLFRHASVVIHHGGAGTTASALYAGAPQIIVPHLGDQGFFASEVERLGCGIKLGKRRWPERLWDKVQEVEKAATYRSKALENRALLEEENGPQTAVDRIETFVAESRRRGGESELMTSNLAWEISA